eukprot:m.145581 g.145581  ORF g.145581 m.145581 type:complete len:436 (+) comp30445_c1_seq2:341-1648(+)
MSALSVGIAHSKCKRGIITRSELETIIVSMRRLAKAQVEGELQLCPEITWSERHKADAMVDAIFRTHTRLDPDGIQDYTASPQGQTPLKHVVAFLERALAQDQVGKKFAQIAGDLNIQGVILDEIRTSPFDIPNTYMLLLLRAGQLLAALGGVVVEEMRSSDATAVMLQLISDVKRSEPLRISALATAINLVLSRNELKYKLITDDVIESLRSFLQSEDPRTLNVALTCVLSCSSCDQSRRRIIKSKLATRVGRLLQRRLSAPIRLKVLKTFRALVHENKDYQRQVIIEDSNLVSNLQKLTDKWYRVDSIVKNNLSAVHASIDKEASLLVETLVPLSKELGNYELLRSSLFDLKNKAKDWSIKNQKKQVLAPKPKIVVHMPKARASTDENDDNRNLFSSHNEQTNENTTVLQLNNRRQSEPTRTTTNAQIKTAFV